MKTSYKDVRVNTKLNEEDYERLQGVCERYGIKSIYLLIQTLVEILIRTADATRDRQHEEGIPVELTEMVEEMLKENKRAAKKGSK